MDHARKFGKSEKATIWKKRHSPPCSTTDKPLVNDEEVTEDKRLANWQKWLADRKKFCKHYGRWTDRDNQDLLINRSPECFRQKVEMKEFTEIIVGLQNKRKPDKYQGNPGFWVTPEFLPKRGNPDLPDISITLTKKQLNLSPVVERITLPELIQQEKGLFCTKKQAISLRQDLFGKSKILGEIKSFQAKELEMTRLAVKGTKLGKKKSDCRKVPVITVTGPDTFEDKNDRSLHPVEDAIILKIQDREIKLMKAESRKEENGRKSLDEISWSLMFVSSGSEIAERAIRLENLGTSAITYHWRLSRTMLTPQTPRDSPFFFNKNKDLILPGQVRLVRVFFRSHVPRSATEFWTLMTDPKLCRRLLVVRFWGSCREISNTSDGEIGPNSDFIERYLDRRIRDTKIQKIIHGIMDNVQENCLPLPAHRSFSLEREIFEAKNPRYHYHSAVVHQFREMYDSVADHDSPPWSLSLNELRRLLLQLKKPEVRNPALVRFNELCRKSVESSLHNPLGITKRSSVYTILCSFADKFEAVNEYARKECFRGPSADITKEEIQQDTHTRNSKKSHQQLSIQKRIASKLSLSTEDRGTSEKIRSGEPFVYHQIFNMRIRAILVDTIVEICGVVDTVNNLQGPGI